MKIISPSDLFYVNPSISLKKYQEVETCGYGYTSNNTYGFEGLGTQRCGVNNLLTYEDTLSLPLSLNSQTRIMYKSLSYYLGEFGTGTRFGIAGMVLDPSKPNDFGELDVKNEKSLINQGDSGGPLLVKTPQGPTFIGINSALIQYNSMILADFHWSTLSEWSEDLFYKAIAEGADIRGLMNKVKLRVTSKPSIASSEQGSAGELRVGISNLSDTPSETKVTVQVTEASKNISLSSVSVEMPSLTGRESVSLLLSKYEISANAVPGDKIFVKGKIILSDRVEDFLIEKVVSVNPATDVYLDYSVTPKVGALFGNSIKVSVVPKFSGNKEKYSVSMNGVGGEPFNLKKISSQDQYKFPEQGVALKFTGSYKMEKSQIGKTIKVQIVVRSGATTVYSEVIELVPR